MLRAARQRGGSLLDQHTGAPGLAGGEVVTGRLDGTASGFGSVMGGVSARASSRNSAAALGAPRGVRAGRLLEDRGDVASGPSAARARCRARCSRSPTSPARLVWMSRRSAGRPRHRPPRRGADERIGSGPRRRPRPPPSPPQARAPSQHRARSRLEPAGASARWPPPRPAAHSGSRAEAPRAEPRAARAACREGPARRPARAQPRVL